MLTLHPSGTRSLYRQITETLQREIADGTLPAGTRLPSSRQLARDLRVSRITVVTAYAEPEAAGAIEARGGSARTSCRPGRHPGRGAGAAKRQPHPRRPPCRPGSATSRTRALGRGGRIARPAGTPTDARQLCRRECRAQAGGPSSGGSRGLLRRRFR